MISVNAEKPSTDVVKASDVDGPFLGVGEVLEEVIVLLAKLELDRQDLVQALKDEKHVAKRLQDRIDELCLWRLRNIGKLTQKGTTWSVIGGFFDQLFACVCDIKRTLLWCLLLCIVHLLVSFVIMNPV